MPNKSQTTARAVERGSPDARSWAHKTAEGFGKAVRQLRIRRGWSAVELANRTGELGYPITRGTIAKIEGNHRSGKLDIGEVIVLAAALKVPPLQLLYSGQPDEPVTYLPVPGLEVRAIEAALHFSGEVSFGGDLRADQTVLQYARRIEHLRQTAAGLRRMHQIDGGLAPEEQARLDVIDGEIAQLTDEIDQRRLSDEMPFYWGVPAEDMMRRTDG